MFATQFFASLRTQAIRLCPANSSDLPLIIANRSAVFFHMAKFEESVADIEDALALGYDASERPNLITRKITALKFLGRENEARVAYEQGLQWADALSSCHEADGAAFRDKVRRNAPFRYVTMFKLRCVCRFPYP